MILNLKILDINLDNAYKVILIYDKCDLLNLIFSLTNGYCTMNIIPKTTIKHYLVSSLRYVSLGALLSSTSFISGVNAQAFKYQNFAYFLDNFCVQGGPTCSHGVLQPSVTSTLPSVGVIIGSDISAVVRNRATQNGYIVGYSDGVDNGLDGGSIALWTDKTATGTSLQELFNDDNSIQLLQNNPTAFAKQILANAGFTLSSFPADNESTPIGQGGYVIWTQDIEKNLQNADYPASAATYIAIFWAGRTLLPNMKIIPVPSSYILKGGTGKNAYGNPIAGATTGSWGLNTIVKGGTNPSNQPDKYLQILNLNPSNTADNIDLMSFMYSVKVNGKPLIDGFLGQQYACKGGDTGTCSTVNADAPPGQLGDDTIVPVDQNLPYALMSAHDNPNQLFSPPDPTLTPPSYPINPYTKKKETPPWSSAYNGCLPFQAGVYWSNSNGDQQTFNPTQYLTPAAVASTSLASSLNSLSRRKNSGSFKLSVQPLGGSAGVNGSVTSTNTAINCNSKSLLGCSQSVGAYQTVTLVANPAPGRKFLYWTGTDSCKGNNPTCSLPVKVDTQVGACFQ